jgi:hypothetical protein
MKIFKSIFKGPPKIAEPVGQSQLSATLAEQSRQQQAQLADTQFALDQRKRGRRSLFSVANRGAGFDELDDKDVTLG